MIATMANESTQVSSDKISKPSVATSESIVKQSQRFDPLSDTDESLPDLATALGLNASQLSKGKSSASGVKSESKVIKNDHIGKH
jgi:hypothetical protein